MAFTIPDQGEGDHNHQSVFYEEDLSIVVAGLSGTDCVLSGLAVTGGTDMTPAVAKGAVLSNGVMFAVAAADVTIGTADATNPRFDLIVVNSSGALAVRAGTAAASPKPPVRSANDVVLYQVYVPANATQITQARCIDKRVIRSQGPIVIAKQTTAVTFSNTAAAETYFSVSVPDGLFLSGKTLRCKAGGRVTANTGSPAVALLINYGGTTMYSDTTATLTNDSVQRAWFLDFCVQAQANNDQALNGIYVLSERGATTGFGDMAAVASTNAPLNGSAAVDSDAGNRTLSVQFDMSSAASTFSITMEYATLELL
jgi:hypothetical protein